MLLACIPRGRSEPARAVQNALVRVAFDSRPSSDPRGVGRYARHLLRALRDTGATRGEIVETHRPRRADVFHAPWMQGAMLHSPCPMVVTIHELGALTRPSERLRGGGIHLRLRHLAVARATHVIVPTEALAHEAVAELGFEREHVVVIPQAPDPADHMACQPSLTAPAWSWQDVGRETWRVYESALARPERPCVGRLSRRRVASAPLGSSSG
jgi:Glycosyltransferase Family 4